MMSRVDALAERDSAPLPSCYEPPEPARARWAPNRGIQRT